MDQAVTGLSDSKDAGIDVIGRQQPVSQHHSPQNLQSQELAKKYSRQRITLNIIGTAFFFVFGLVTVASGFSTILEGFCRRITSNDYVAFTLFVAGFGSLERILSLPLSYYSGFILEHKYRLSNQAFRAWIWEGVKGLLVGIPIGLPVLLVFYACLKNFASLWWLPVGMVIFVVSVLLARVAPILIFPIFYKFKPVADEKLKSRIVALCGKAGVVVQGVFVFDMSKNTKKANAAFTGIGKSKRIVLGDTLVANLTDEEIEAVFAHELGHYRLHHIWVSMAVGTLSTFLGLFCTALLYQWSLSLFGFSRIDQIAALPLLSLWLGVYSLVTSPAVNVVSRAHERAADRYALRTINNKEAFINAMKKLAAVNLSDTTPHPVIEFLFHSHPSIDKRIRAAQQY
ncbi:MAG: M48 family metallopeptidase [Bacteroidota bacterium]